MSSWNSIFNMTFLVGLFSAAVRMTVPVLLSGIGETFSERSGVLNIGLEGVIIIGSFSGFVAAYYSGSVIIGLLGGIISGLFMGLLISFLSISLGVNQMISGIAINTLGAGLTSYLYRLLFGVMVIPPQAPSLSAIKIPILGDIPFLGEVLFQQNILVYITYFVVPVAAVVLYKTTFGLKVRAVGEHPKATETVGVSVRKIRYRAICICGVLSGLAGAYLSIGQLNMFMDGISAGRGFIALAAVIFGKWDPVGVMGAAFLFAFADALQLRLQSIGFAIPYQFLVMLPYVLTTIALVGLGRSNGPAALGAPYKKEK